MYAYTPPAPFCNELLLFVPSVILNTPSLIKQTPPPFSAEVFPEIQRSPAGSVSKSACGILFRQFLHKTPIGYLIDYRLRKAEHLLTATGRKITDIAFGVGSPSVSYFIGTFRKTYGISPNRYRKAISIS